MADSFLMNEILEYIKMHVTEGLLLKQVAQRYYVSYDHLSKLILKQTGLTYRQYVIAMKINMAKHMLENTNMCIEQIAYAVGYRNYISFYHAFKQNEGVCPSEYRLYKTEQTHLTTG